MLEMPLFQSVKPAKEGLLIVPGHGVIMTEGIATKRAQNSQRVHLCLFAPLCGSFLAPFCGTRRDFYAKLWNSLCQEFLTRHLEPSRRTE